MKGLIFMVVTLFFLMSLLLGVNVPGAWGRIMALGGFVGLIGWWWYCAASDSKRPDGSERAELGAGSPPDRWM